MFAKLIIVRMSYQYDLLSLSQIANKPKYQLYFLYQTQWQ